MFSFFFNNVFKAKMFTNEIEEKTQLIKILIAETCRMTDNFTSLTTGSFSIGNVLNRLILHVHTVFGLSGMLLLKKITGLFIKLIKYHDCFPFSIFCRFISCKELHEEECKIRLPYFSNVIDSRYCRVYIYFVRGGVIIFEK